MTTRASSSSSNLHRRQLCPGSERAERGLPNMESPYAAEGTLLHHMDANPGESREALSAEQCETLERNARLRDDFLAAKLSEFGVQPEDPCKIIVEQEFWLCDADGVPWEHPETKEGFPGHPDRIHYFPKQKLAIIFDSKFGRIPVPKAEINMQLRSYVVMFAENYDCEMIIAAITQPWVPESDFHSACYTKEHFPIIKSEILSILANCQSPEAKRTPSEDACQYCRANGTEQCTESLDVAARLAELNISKMTVAELESLSGEMQMAAKVVLSWERRIRYIAEKTPDALKHHKLGESQIMREITDPPQAFQALYDAGLLGPDLETAIVEFNSCVDASRSQLERLIAKNRSMTQKEAKDAVMKICEPWIKETPKAPPLVRI